MKYARLLGILILVLLLGNSCKTYKNLEKVKPKTESASMIEELKKLKYGDRIKVLEKNGSNKTLDYIKTEDGVLRGLMTKRPKGDLVSISVEDIVLVQVRKGDVKSTVLSTVGIGTIVVLVGIWLLFASQGGYN